MMDDLVQRRLHRRQGGEFLDQRVPRVEGLLAEDGAAAAVEHGLAADVAILVGKAFLQLHREGVLQIFHNVFPGRQVDGQVVPFRSGDFGDAPFHHGLAGGHQLDHGATAGGEVGLDSADQGRALHGGQQVAEKALLGALEGGQGGGFGVPVERLLSLRDAGGLQRLLDVGVDDLERVGVGIEDALLFGRQGVFEDIDLDALVGQGAGLVEAEGLEVAGDDFHGRDPAGFHGGDELGAGIERGFSRAPQAEALGVGQAGDGGGAGGGDVEHAGVRQGVLQPQSRPALLGRGDLAAAALRAHGVGQGVAFVEHDDAGKGGAAIVAEAAGEPRDDLVEAGTTLLARRASQGGVGAKQDARAVGNLAPLAELAQGDDVLPAAPEGGPVAPRVLDQLVALGQPQGAFAPAQPVVEDDAGGLAALAAAGAVAEHPAPAEAYRRRQRPAAGVVLSAGLLFPVLWNRRDVLPIGLDAVFGGEAAGVGFAGEDEAFDLGVGQRPPGDQPCGQHGPVGRRGVGHGRHGGGLDQGRRMGVGAADPHRVGPPGFVDRVAGRRRIRGAGLVGDLANLSPIAFAFRLGLGWRLARGGASRGVAEQVADGRRFADGQPRRRLGDDGVEQGGGVRGDGLGIDIGAGLRAPVQHGQAGVEAGAPAGVGAAGDGGGERHPGVEAGEGPVPFGIAGQAMARGDGHQASAGEQCRERGAHVAQIGVADGPIDIGAGRERRVHRHHGGAESRQVVADGLAVVAADGSLREQALQQPGAGGGDLVEVRRGRPRALGHRRQHACAG